MTRIAGRYEIKSKLGEGGMGVVFRAYDPKPLDREVAVKTLHEFSDPFARELFYKECSALKSLSHPNIVEIFDMGEYEDAGHKRPFFVMPMLSGQTLDELIRKASHRLTVDRVVEIFTQTCRGLQAAHDHGLIHRDLKPSNIFVMSDDSVKIIDFGVAHSATERSRSGYGKGTLIYMAPEQLQHKPVSVQSDIYALGVTLYEALTRRHPFRTNQEAAIIQAILTQIPAPASDLNPGVSHVISRTIHKAMAKRPWNRFDSAREFGETLQKAYRNEPIALFDPARTQPRIQTAQRALEKGDFQFAGEIVSELEEEGSIDPQLRLLRAQIDQIGRRKTVAQLLQSAEARFEEQEDPLALQKIQEVLHLDPANVTALALKNRIEGRRHDRQIDKWLHLAQQHLANRSFGHARDAVQHALELRPKDTRATRLLKDVEREESEYILLRREKTEMYQAAVNAWQNGEVSQALSQMRHVLDLDRRAPDDTSPDASSTYQSFYDRLRTEYDAMSAAYADAKRHLAGRDFAQALALCDTFLRKYPGQALFQALKFDVEAQQRQSLSAYIAEVDRKLEAEPDLDAKLSLVTEAAAEFPHDDHFKRLVKLYRDKRDLVASIVERAKVHETAGQLTEALSDLETLGAIHAAYPGLAFEKDRLQRRLEQQTRAASRARALAQIDARLQAGDVDRAVELLGQAEAEYPGDAELVSLRNLVQQRADRAARARDLVAEGQRLCAAGEFDAGLASLRSALGLDDGPAARSTLRDALVDRAQAIFEERGADAESLVNEALELDPYHPLARTLRARALERRRDETVAATRTAAVPPALAPDATTRQMPPPDAETARMAEPLAETRRLEVTRLSGGSASDVTRRAADPPAAAGAAPTAARVPASADAPTATDAAVTVAQSAPAVAQSAPAVAGAPPTDAQSATTVAHPPPRATTPPRPAHAPAPPAAPAATSQPSVAAPAGMDARSRRNAVWVGIAAIILIAAGAWALLVRPGGEAGGSGEGAGVTIAGNAQAPQPAPEVPPPPPVQTPTDPGAAAASATPAPAPATSPLEALSTPRGAPARGQTTDPARPAPPANTPINPASAAAGSSAVAPPTPTPAPTRVATTTRLVLTDWPAGVVVTVGGRRIGSIAPNGSLTDDAVTPGRHSVRFQREGHEDVVIDADFAAGSPLALSGAGRAWRALPPPAAGVVTVKMHAGPDVRVTVSREDGSGARTFRGSSDLALAPGTYRVEAHDLREPIPMPPAVLRVEPGAARDYDVPYVRGLQSLQFSRWSDAGGGWVRLREREAMLDAPVAGGRVVFTARVNGNYFRSGPFQNGGPLTWVYGYENDENYYAVSLMAAELHIQRRANGAALTTVQQIPHQIVPRPSADYDRVDAIEIEIDFSGAAPAHRYRLHLKTGAPTPWAALPGAFPRASGGRFGFLASAPNLLVIRPAFRFYPPVR